MNRLLRPVSFAFEPDLVSVFARASFGAAGAPTLDTKNSKGVCGLSLNTLTFTGTTANASPTVTGVSSFAGLYVGMTITGTNIPGGTTISSMNGGAATITMSANATGVNAGLSASGGQYTMTFGSQLTPVARLDAYNKLLDLGVLFDLSGLQGGAGVVPNAAAGPAMLLLANNISNASLANIIFQFGTYSGSTFTAQNPSNGEKAIFNISLCRSGAI